MKKIINVLWLVLLIDIFSFNIAKADPIDPTQFLKPSFGSHYAWQAMLIFVFVIFIGIVSEIIAGYFLFFRKNKADLMALVWANVVSYPFFYLFSNLFPFHPILFGEMLVVLIETLIIKAYLKDKISLRKALLVSVVINLTSIIVSFIASLVLIILFEVIFSPASSSF